MPREPENRQLSLRLDGGKLTATRFIKAVSSFHSTVRSVVDEAVSARDAAEWIVSVREGSSIVDFNAAPTLAPFPLVEDAVAYFVTGLAALDSGTTERPRHFSDAALGALKELATSRDDGLEVIEIIASDEVVSAVSQSTLQSIEAITKDRYASVGSIEGKLEGVNIHQNPRCSVYEDLSGRAIECRFEPHQFPQIKDALGARVSVFGLITYRPDHQPKSIRMEHLRVLRAEHELPDVDDIIGLFRGNA